MTAPPAERGFALIVAVLGMGLFALFALALLDTSRGTAATARATIVHARLSAAADAGLAIAVANLAAADRTRRWTIDGRAREVRFGDAVLTITVIDERGKIPINQITDEQARSMFEAAGASGEALDSMVDGFLDWRDDDDEVRENGAELGHYEGLGYRPRNGALRSVEELGAIRGIDAATVARLRPLIAVYRDQREGFDERFASPEAIAVMEGGLAGPQAIQRARERAGQRVAIDLAPTESLVGRPLTILVVARGGDGGVVRRATLVELTGAREQPYVVRQRG